MKTLITILFLCLSVFSRGENLIRLEEPKSNEAVPAGKAIFYGKFIQRLGFKSGGYPQDIRIVNIDTHETYTFRVKTTFKAAKENVFCYVIEPGTYAIVNYWWTKSTWYGGKSHIEPIFKGIEVNDKLQERVDTGELKEEDFEMYSFTVSPNTLHYLGTWDFSKSPVSFSDEKGTLDNTMISKYKKLDFPNAKTTLPE
ncbi:hypothetical protein [Parabacteroides sp. AM08-6]|uniref:hypothetical protein n=1 Tax=Parabacteroides sp. AM08-6 TaxID=2292053 RepID=UPI000EFED3AD|nr:hypothetical protein [Parabacteroides sp. AM08-6]RHJ84327.1 hypothetical protein DW103_05695 [Parabacteroides sp. AM08-6]